MWLLLLQYCQLHLPYLHLLQQCSHHQLLPEHLSLLLLLQLSLWLMLRLLTPT